MNKTTILQKGYTIIVDSYEGDLNHPDRNEMTVSTKEEVDTVLKICKELFISARYSNVAIGNRDEDEGIKLIEDYLKDNPSLNMTVEGIKELNYDLCGYPQGGDWDYFRTLEGVQVVYTPEDIEVELIENFSPE